MRAERKKPELCEGCGVPDGDGHECRVCRTPFYIEDGCEDVTGLCNHCAQGCVVLLIDAAKAVLHGYDTDEGRYERDRMEALRVLVEKVSPPEICAPASRS